MLGTYMWPTGRYCVHFKYGIKYATFLYEMVFNKVGYRVRPGPTNLLMYFVLESELLLNDCDSITNIGILL